MGCLFRVFFFFFFAPFTFFLPMIVIFLFLFFLISLLGRAMQMWIERGGFAFDKHIRHYKLVYEKTN